MASSTYYLIGLYSRLILVMLLLVFNASLICSLDWYPIKLSLILRVFKVVYLLFSIFKKSPVMWSQLIWHFEISSSLRQRAIWFPMNALAISEIDSFSSLSFKTRVYRLRLPLRPLPMIFPPSDPMLQWPMLRNSRILLQLKNFWTILKCLKSLSSSFLEMFSVLTLLLVFRHTSKAYKPSDVIELLAI